MLTSLSTALSALNADSTAVDVVGNNLANLETTGFKASSVQFHDLVNEALAGSGNFSSPGLGTAPPTITQVFTQGAIQSTNGPLDAAIQGDGFFVVNDSSGNQLFTRDGNFKVDSNGVLETSTGEHVQGWTATTGTLSTNGATGDMVLPSGSLRDPLPTANFSLQLNLDASQLVGSPGATFSSPMQVYDSLGTVHTLTVSLTKTASNAWSYNVTIPGEDLTAGTSGTPSQLASGSLAFDSQGHLTTPAPPPPTSNASIPIAATGLADGAADLNMNWNVYDPTTNVANLTQLSSPSSVGSSTQDGSPAAELVKITMGNDGQIIAQYSTSDSRVVGQVAVASIRNADSLSGAGNNNLKATAQTALPSIGAADTGGRGSIVGGALESSTVDIAREFTNLIVLQRAYEANGKVVTTSDQLSQDTINLKQ